MKKFLGIASEKKTQQSAANKIGGTRASNSLRNAAKKKTEKLMTIFNYEYQESDLEQFVF